MSEPKEVGQPIVNIEKVVTVLPDGRKVTKTIKKITHQYQVEVPAGTPIPEGARIVSTSAAEVPAGTVVNHYQTPSTSSDSGTLNPQDYLQFQNGTVKSEPTVVVQSMIDENGRKVTKTTTTTTSSNTGSPISKLFKRLSMNSANLLKTKSDRKSDSKADSKVDSKVDTKPLPSIPVVVQHEPEVKVQVIKTESKQHAPETKVHIETVKYEGPDGEDVIPLSDCSGERRAVLVGVNYTGGPNPLNGCVNDTAVMRTFLLEQGFKDENIHVLTDDPVGSHGLPTRENMLNHLRWLIHDAQRNDSYFFHYSGHGGQTLDLDGDETDGKDSCLFPLDYVEKGVIIDDELHDILVKTLPEGVRLTALFDCCHSGSALDLPYIYASTGYVRGSSAYANLGHELVEGDFDEAGLKELRLKWARLQEEEKEFKRQVHLKAAKAEVILFSGCQDDQTSADVKVTRNGNSSSNGAMTYAFTKCVREYPDQSYQEMLVTIRKLLKEKKYKQKPQLSSCREMNMSSTFRM